MVYAILATASIKKNLSYVWAHLANNAGSALFGYVYMALWHAASRGRAIGSFSPHQLIGYIAVGQLVLWTTTFIPAGLGVQQHIRTGQIALELARPVPYFPRMFASGSGEVLYNLVFRCLPLGIVFYLSGGLPLQPMASPRRIILFLLAVCASSATGLMFQYLIGITSFWTVETRWARRLMFALTMFCGGQLLPIPLMPTWLQHGLVWLPFQSLVYFPVSVWLGMDKATTWSCSIVWVVILILTCEICTRAAARRVEVQGG